MEKIILILMFGSLFGTVDEDEFAIEISGGMSSEEIEELSGNQIDETYHSSIIPDSSKIKPRKFIGIKIGWNMGNKKLRKYEMLKILWQNPSTHYELTSFMAKREYTERLQTLSQMLFVGSYVIKEGNINTLRIASVCLLFGGWLSLHEQKHITKAVQIYNGEAIYTPQNPFTYVN